MDLELAYESFDTWVSELRRKKKIDLHTAKDIVQDTFIHFWKIHKSRNFELPEAYVTQFIRRSLINRYKDYMKKKFKDYARDRVHHDSLINKALSVDAPWIESALVLSGPSEPYMREFYTKGETRVRIAKKFKTTHGAVRRKLETGRQRVKFHLQELVPLLEWMERHYVSERNIEEEEDEDV